MREYIRGVEDTLEAVLMLMNTCKSLKQLRKKIQEMLSDLIEGKTEQLMVILSRKN